MSLEDTYAQEIRGWLLGRLSKSRNQGPLKWARSIRLPSAPIRWWWTFEGRHYPTLDGRLADQWGLLARRGLRLLETYNPRRRSSARPIEVYWTSTIATGGLMTWPRSYVCHSAGVGLGEDERAALLGWRQWIQREWSRWCDAYHTNATDLAALDAWGAPTPLQLDDAHTLGRWASIARRSRWPLLHEVVADSLRYWLEPEQCIDQLPLPAKHEQLLELVCLVRILGAMLGTPRVIRWLDNKLNQNVVHADHLELYYQLSVDASTMLATPLFEDGLANAMERFRLRTPRDIDLFLPLTKVDTTFDGLLVEVKSGSQDASGALWQLRAYREAMRSRGYTRCVVWAVAESARRLDTEDRRWVEDRLEAGGDLWIVSHPDDIAKVLAWVGLGSKPN